MIQFSGDNLAILANGANAQAFERLLETHQGIIFAAARRACGHRSWSQYGDDALAAARIGFWMACQQFAPQQHDWPKLAFSMARAEARRAMRSMDGGSSGTPVGDDLGESPKPVDLSTLLEGLSLQDAAIATKLSEGHSQRETARILGIGRQSVRSAVKRMRQVLADDDSARQ